MRPASLFVVVVYALLLFGGISDVNGGFLKDLLKFGKKGVDQANEAIEEAESSSKPLLHDFQAHDPAFLRNQHPPPTLSEAERLAIMYPYDQETFSERQQQVWTLMQQQEVMLKELVNLYRSSQTGLRGGDSSMVYTTIKGLQEHVQRLTRDFQDRQKLGVNIGRLDAMPQLIPASQSLLKAWEILERNRPSSEMEMLAQSKDLYKLVMEIEGSLSAALEQRRVCKALDQHDWLRSGQYNILKYAWEDYEDRSRTLRHEAISLYARIDEKQGYQRDGDKVRATPLQGFLARLNFPKLEGDAEIEDVRNEDWNKEWMMALGKVKSIAEEREWLLKNLGAGRRTFDDDPMGIV